jgi:hypothetical protein
MDESRILRSVAGKGVAVPRQNTDLPSNQVYRSGAHFEPLNM